MCNGNREWGSIRQCILRLGRVTDISASRRLYPDLYPSVPLFLSHELERCISFKTGIDGVVEWNNTVGIDMLIGHLQTVWKRPVRQYEMLKKHLGLRSFIESHVRL